MIYVVMPIVIIPSLPIGISLPFIADSTSRQGGLTRRRKRRAGPQSIGAGRAARRCGSSACGDPPPALPTVNEAGQLVEFPRDLLGHFQQ